MRRLSVIRSIHTRSGAVAALSALLLAAPALGDGLEPGSVLVFPVHTSVGSDFTAVAVTNLDLVPATPVNGLGGTTSLHYEFVNVIDTPGQPGFAQSCFVSDRVETLTPGDTRVATTACDDPGANRGYLVVSALDPNAFDRPWSHNRLVGSELVITFEGGLHVYNAVPFRALAPKGSATDADGDGQLDFDGVEYEGLPDMLFLDSFLADTFQGLTLLSFSGGSSFTANVRMDVLNDNEQALSATVAFRCWISQPLVEYSLVFDPFFLRQSTLQDPEEFDIDCRVQTGGEIETGWARIRGSNHASSAQTCPDVALLGALGQGSLDKAGARRLWESRERQLDGDFLKTGTFDPECGADP